MDHSHPRDTPETPDVPGYQLLGRLGEGGMGVVFKARHLGLNRLVALKVLRAGLDHRLRGAALPPAASARLVADLARATQAVHELDLVHRDLKPANILLTDDGVPKIADFGLAKFLDDPDRSATHPGDVLGTPSYMAPEQAAGRAAGATAAADVYGLGAILYECLAGRPPFQAPTAAETPALVRTRDPSPVRALRPGVPRDLEAVCLKCLHKEPRHRYPSARALADDLQRFLEGKPPTEHPIAPVVHPKSAWAAFADGNGIAGWDLHNGTRLAGFAAPEPARIVFDPAGRLWGSRSAEVFCWDFPGGKAAKPWHTREVHPQPPFLAVESLAAGERGVLAGSQEGHGWLLRLEGGEVRMASPGWTFPTETAVVAAA